MAGGRVSRLNAFCVEDAAGKVLARGKAASDPGAWFEVLVVPGPRRNPRLGSGHKMAVNWVRIDKTWYCGSANPGVATICRETGEPIESDCDGNMLQGFSCWNQRLSRWIEEQLPTAAAEHGSRNSPFSFRRD